MIKIYSDVEFPLCIAIGAKASKEYKTQIVGTDAGKEQRGIEWLTHNRSFNIGTSIRNIDDLEKVIALLHVCEGSYAGFLMKDPTDWRSGIGEESFSPMLQDPVDPLEWYFFKSVSVIDLDDATLTRDFAYHCRFVIISTIVIQDEGSTVYNYEVDKINGKVFFDTEPVAPEAKFQYNIAVRFVDDKITELYNWSEAGEINCILEQMKLPYRFELEDNIHYITSVPYTINVQDSTTSNSSISVIKGVLSPTDIIEQAASINEMSFRNTILKAEDFNSYDVENAEMISGVIESVVKYLDAGDESYDVENAIMISGIIDDQVIFHDLTIHDDDIERYDVLNAIMISGVLE